MRDGIHGATRVLQEAYSWLVQNSVGELRVVHLHSARAVRRVLYATAQWTLVPSGAADEPAGGWLLRMLPFLMYVRLLHGVTPCIEAGESEPPAPREEPVQEIGSSASSSHTWQPRGPPPQVPPARFAPRPRLSEQSTAAQTVPTLARAPSPTGAQRVSRASSILLQVQWEAVTPEVVREAVAGAEDFQLAPPSSASVPTHLLPQDNGTFLWNGLKNEPVGPVCRTSGEFPVMQIQGSRHVTLQQWGAIGGHFAVHDRSMGMQIAGQSLQHWIAARPEMQRRLGALQRRAPPWMTPGDHHTDECLHGTWFFAPLDTGALQEPQITGYHGTSLHALYRACVVGAEDGWNGLSRNGVMHLGVYFHTAARSWYCQNYMMYTSLDTTGYLWSAMLQISTPEWDPRGRRTTMRTSGITQNLTYQDVCHVTGLWFHVVHVLQLVDAPASVWIAAEPRWAGEVEPTPNATRAQLMEAARARAQESAR